jgi:hypothetical protein
VPVGGIIVSPLDLQRGAKLVAAHANIQHVILDPRSTTSEYIMRFLNQVFIGVAESVPVKDGVTIQVIRDGQVIEERHDE